MKQFLRMKSGILFEKEEFKIAIRALFFVMAQYFELFHNVWEPNLSLLFYEQLWNRGRYPLPCVVRVLQYS